MLYATATEDIYIAPRIRAYAKGDPVAVDAVQKHGWYDSVELPAPEPAPAPEPEPQEFAVEE